jgi:hypothetical protein
MNETKSRERFVSLAENRVKRAMKDIRLIGNLSNRSNYTYTDDDVKKIVRALENELTKMKKNFESKTGSDEVEFRLE